MNRPLNRALTGRGGGTGPEERSAAGSAGW